MGEDSCQDAEAADKVNQDKDHVESLAYVWVQSGVVVDWETYIPVSSC